MAEINTDQTRPWCVLGMGELGKMFCDNFEDKLGGQCQCWLVDDPAKCCVVDDLAELQEYCASDARSEDLFWILIAEYDQDIWEKSLENDVIEKLVQEISVRFIMIHPKNNVVTTTERQFIQLVAAGEIFGKIVLAMPDMERKTSKKTMCKALYDIIAACSMRGYVNIDYGDLYRASHRNNRYGMVYHEDCTHGGQMKHIVENIKSQVEREIPAGDIKFAALVVTSDRSVSLMSLADVAAMIVNTIGEDTPLVWGHVLTESEWGITLVVFREMTID